MKEIDEVKEDMKKLLKSNDCTLLVMYNGEIINVDVYLVQSIDVGSITCKL